MANFQNFFLTVSRMKWSDYLDILVVALLIYSMLPLLRTPNVMKIARTVGALVLIAWLTGAAVTAFLYKRGTWRKKQIEPLRKPYPKTDENWHKIDRSIFKKNDDDKAQKLTNVAQPTD